MKKVAGLAVTLGLLLSSVVAQAQEFGTQGRAVFGAERLFGLTWSHRSEQSLVPGVPDSYDNTSGMAFMWHVPNDPRNPFEVPRVAFDYFVIDHLSVGGTLAYMGGSISRPLGGNGPAAMNGATVSTDYSDFAFAPRVGFAYMFGSVVGIWPHAGFTYHSYSVDTVEKGNGFALDLDAMFVFAVTPHFGFTAGPNFDIDVSGSRTPEAAAERDQHFRQFGIQVGMIGWL
ncbi:MAG TPA: hypothetical protein VGI10_02730 [Polyangiaceae bacterium]|jgi:hypothetical protein